MPTRAILNGITLSHFRGYALNFQQKRYKIIQPPRQETVCLKKAVYLPIKVKTAAPSARIPIRTAGMPGMNVERP
jgi:hypothetical protein